MTIEYKDSKRIVALSTESLLTSSDYTSSNFTTVGSTVAITSNSVVFTNTPTNSDNGQYKQITALAESDVWSLDCIVNNSSGNTYDNIFLGLSSGSSAWQTSGQNEIKLQTQGTGYMRFALTTRISGSNSQTASSNNSYSYGTDYYCTLSSDGTDITFKVWTNSGRTGTASVTLTRPVSGLGTMNYIQHRSRNSGDSNTWSGTVSEVALSRTPAKPTNIQDNSLLVEKDTARRYWFDADTETETESTGTYTWTGDIGTYDNNRQGFYVANTSSVVYGKTINSVSFWLHKTGSPTGTATVGVWSNSGSGSTYTLAHTFGTLDVSTLTGSFVKYTFDTGSHTLAVGDTVGIYSPTTNVSNTVEMQGAVSDQYDGVNTIRGRNTASGWSPVTTHDIRFAITEITPTWTMQPTKQFDFSSSTGWTTVGSNISITGGAITANAMVTQGSANRIYYDLGSALSDKFVIDFDHYADTASAGGFWQMFALTDTTAIPKTDDGIYPLIDMGSWTTYLRYSNEGSETNVGTLGSLTTGQWQYVRFVRDGTTGTLTVYSDSARTTQVLNVSGTIPATVTGLRYFQSGSLPSANTGTTTYKIDNLKIYDGVTSIN